MSRLGKTVSFAACTLIAASIAAAPSLAFAGKGGGGGKGGMSGATGKGSGSGSWGGMSGSKGKTGGSSSWGGMGSSSGKSSSGSRSGSSGKSSSGSSSSSTAKSGKSTKHPDHYDHDHDYAKDHDHDHDHDYHHHHHPYYGGFPVVIGGDVVSGEYIASTDPCIETVVPVPQFDTPVAVPTPIGVDQVDAADAAPQFYTIYFKDRSGKPQTYGRFDSSTEQDRLAETQDKLTAAGVAWWTVDPNGVQVDTDINQ
jgi:hypothetical protein